MDEEGLWQLFERTGLPEAYLALWAAREEREAFDRPARTAFGDGPGRTKEI